MSESKKNILISFFFFSAIFILISIFSFIDLHVNEWLYDVVLKWKWYNYLTSSHAITAMYISKGLLGGIISTSFLAIGTALPLLIGCCIKK